MNKVELTPSIERSAADFQHLSQTQECTTREGSEFPRMTFARPKCRRRETHVADIAGIAPDGITKGKHMSLASLRIHRTRIVRNLGEIFKLFGSLESTGIRFELEHEQEQELESELEHDQGQDF